MAEMQKIQATGERQDLTKIEEERFVDAISQ